MPDPIELYQEQQRQVFTQLSNRLIFPGSFNPLHAGHQKLASVAERRFQQKVVLEMSVANVDKPNLSEAEVRRRLQYLTTRPVAVTHAATFQSKAELFPESVFVVGFDTAVRLLDPVYYNGRIDMMHRSLQQIHDAGCRFFVGGRLTANAFLTVQDLDIDTRCRSLFEGTTEREFREDISSTELRNRPATGP